MIATTVANICPDCSKPLVGVQYAYDSPYHYDGVSEYACLSSGGCGYRIGRWSMRELASGEVEHPLGITTNHCPECGAKALFITDNNDKTVAYECSKCDYSWDI